MTPFAIALSAALVLAAAIVRVWPQLRYPPGGCDSWYYLGYVRELRRTKRFPVALPGYLMDIPEQWYPPLFPLLLTIVPPRVIDRVHWLVAPIADLAVMALALVTVGRSTGSLVAVAVAGIAYAVTPTLVHESQVLSSRPFGALLVAVALLLAIEAPTALGVALASVGVAAVLLSHKLSTQFLAVAFATLALATGDLRYIGIPLFGLVLAFLLSGGFYAKVLRGHADILRFWRRHHAYYTAHLVDDSPLLGAGRTSRSLYYRPGVRGALYTITRLALHQPFLVWLVAAAAAGAIDPFFWWASTAGLCAIATTVVPGLRFLGEGHKYWKFSALPLSVVGGRMVADGDLLAGVAFVAALAAALIADALVFRRERAAGRERDNDALDRVIDHVRASPFDRLVCLPVTIADQILFRSGRAVLWGSHSAGFSLLEGFYPVITRPFAELVGTWRLEALVLDRRYTSPERLGLADATPSFTAGEYAVYPLTSSREPGAPTTAVG